MTQKHDTKERILIMNEKLNTLLEDQDFIEKLTSAETDAEVQALLAENGVELTLEEINAVKKGVEARISEDGELSEDELENVAGGADIAKIIEVICSGIVKLGDAVHKWTRRRW